MTIEEKKRRARVAQHKWYYKKKEENPELFRRKSRGSASKSYKKLGKTTKSKENGIIRQKENRIYFANRTMCKNTISPELLECINQYFKYKHLLKKLKTGDY